WQWLWSSWCRRHLRRADGHGSSCKQRGLALRRLVPEFLRLGNKIALGVIDPQLGDARQDCGILHRLGYRTHAQDVADAVDGIHDGVIHGVGHDVLDEYAGDLEK